MFVHPERRRTNAIDCLVNGGEMGALMRSMDWSKTPLGPVETWSASLCMMVRLLLANRFQLLLWWGPQFRQLYNDPFRPSLGAKHPKSMGQPASECWPEIWHIIGPLIETPFNGGPATWIEDLALELNRHGFLEEAHFTVAYSPVPDDTAPGGIGGVLATVHEITEKVVGDRRVSVLRDLGTRSADAKTAEGACVVAAQSLTQHAKDIPFALLYLIDSDRKHARLAATFGVEKDKPASPLVIDLREPYLGVVWPISEVMRNDQMLLVENLAGHLKRVPSGPWSEPPHNAVLVPVRSNIAHQLAGVLVAGISPRLRFDPLYRSFLDLVSNQVATAVANGRAYEEERKRAEVLAELDRAKTTFFSNVSHEFRTPLTLMLGPVEDILASPDVELARRHRQQLMVVHRNSLRLLKLVNSLLDFSRIEAGRMEAVYQPTDISSFTAELASSFRSAIERAGLAYEIECEPVSEQVFIDHDMWEKIVLNLISNAFKFTFQGKISVTVKSAGDFVHLQIGDTGTGIPEHDLTHLFERFYRVQGARGRTYEGTGIGLALVQELVKLHRGSVKVKSTPGHGSTFTVLIPKGKSHLPGDRIEAARTIASSVIPEDSYVEEAERWLPPELDELVEGLGEADADASSKAASALSQVGELRSIPELIVLADDNSDMRDYVRRLLSKRYRVHGVSNGVDALKAARELNADLVLSDVMMPGMDGFEVLRALRSDPATRSKPVILLSARAGEESRLEGLQEGADDYLVKPFTARELMARVGAHLKMARIRSEATELERRLRAEAEQARTQLEVRVKERTTELENSQETLRTLNQRLVEAQDEERRRLALALHDSAGQLLVALKWKLGPIQQTLGKPAELVKIAKESVELLDELSKEIRTVSHLLHPPLLDEAGLSTALRAYLEGLRERSGLAVNLELDPSLARQPRDIETTVFRIIQEALTNIHRYAQTRTATVRIFQDSENVRVEIQDQGQGIPNFTSLNDATFKMGVGIQGMRERVRHLRGKFEIQSGKAGTTVRAILPRGVSSHEKATGRTEIAS